MYNFTSGSKCHLHLYSIQSQKLIYINVRLLPVERNVIIGQVWTCMCPESLMHAQQMANPVFSRTHLGGCARAGWCLSVPLVTVGQEWDPAPLQTEPSAPHLLCSNPLGHLHPRSCSSLLFLAHHCGRSLSWSPRARSSCRAVKCLVFKEALSEASGSFLNFRETENFKSAVGKVGLRGYLFQMVIKSKVLVLTRFSCVYCPFQVQIWDISSTG